MTGLIDTLERDGFVRRVPDPDDRRVLSVVLTPGAQQLLRETLPGHFQLMNTLMRSLSASECQTLVTLLNKIIEQAAEMSAAAVN
jgi:DNA-binding MarR family transcriptional regulator